MKTYSSSTNPALRHHLLNPSVLRFKSYLPISPSGKILQPADLPLWRRAYRTPLSQHLFLHTNDSSKYRVCQGKSSYFIIQFFGSFRSSQTILVSSVPLLLLLWHIYLFFLLYILFLPLHGLSASINALYHHHFSSKLYYVT